MRTHSIWILESAFLHALVAAAVTSPTSNGAKPANTPTLRSYSNHRYISLRLWNRRCMRWCMHASAGCSNSAYILQSACIINSSCPVKKRRINPILMNSQRPAVITLTHTVKLKLRKFHHCLSNWTEKMIMMRSMWVSF